MAERIFSEQLYRIRDLHIDVEFLLQSLAALQGDNPCASCANVCCKEPLCRESIDSDFLRFLLGTRTRDYSAEDGRYVPGSGCRLEYGRPLVCYEYFCARFDGHDVHTLKQLSRALKTTYKNVYAGRHILVVDDITRISVTQLGVILERLKDLRTLARAALDHALNQQLRNSSKACQVKMYGTRTGVEPVLSGSKPYPG